MKILKTIFSKCLCLMGHHSWTSAHEQNIEITQEQLEDPIIGFWDYAKMYCKCCGKVYERSLKLMEQSRKDENKA